MKKFYHHGVASSPSPSSSSSTTTTTRNTSGNDATQQFSSSSRNDDDDDDEEEVDPSIEYLTSLGHKDARLQEGMKDALKGVFGNNIAVSHLKSLGEEGLKALANSVQQQLALTNNDGDELSVHVDVPHHNFSFDLNVKEGENFMQSAKEGNGRELLGEYLECVCGGTMSCATCHIILDADSYAKLDPPIDAECDMLDLAFEPTETSRLGCQVVMTKELGNRLVVTIPSGMNNFWS
eukprot:CAMPEP_0198256722 /NCGR_PEP_ID=MMETSP1447-20131203/6554_1 /TAXON_ID=420782 /ORGANISM="Chaetoceros dichaeta, Strain CCMP1751" /LENGTH=235 /DNA_ID=CAMNT_0043943421 /DNA_START=304 /DNA_END=1011 /DNA_ORIENTATION=-